MSLRECWGRARAISSLISEAYRQGDHKPEAPRKSRIKLARYEAELNALVKKGNKKYVLEDCWYTKFEWTLLTTCSETGNDINSVL